MSPIIFLALALSTAPPAEPKVEKKDPALPLGVDRQGPAQHRRQHHARRVAVRHVAGAATVGAYRDMFKDPGSLLVGVAFVADARGNRPEVIRRALQRRQLAALGGVLGNILPRLRFPRLRIAGQHRVARPEGAPRAGLIVFQEIFGINSHIRDITERFAREGYLAIAPELFHRTGPGFDLDGC